MEFRAQDNEMRTPGGSLSYIHLTTKESSGGERRRVGIHNGSSTPSGLTCTQTLDYPHHVVQPPPPPPLHVRDPEPDRVTTGTGAGGPKLKSPSSASTIRYRECLKNHAASIGGNVFDGCGEFMPCGEEGTLEALKCAACDCHRNFHRKEIDGESQYSPGSRRSLVLTPLQLPPPLPSPSSAGLGGHHHHHHHQKFSIGYHGNHPTASIVQPMNVAYGSAGGTESSSEDLNMFHSTAEAPMPPPPFALSKKRFRTKFTQEQKDRMLEFAEKMDWKIQKQDEEEVEKFCAEVGVKRQVLKVWMHNNKSTIKKQQQQQESSNQSLEMIEADQPEPEAEAEPEGVDN